MTDNYYKKIFSKNLRHYMELNNKTQIDLINDLGINKSAISTWCNGTRLPRMDKVDMLAKYFHINRSDLIEEKTASSGAYYFLDDRTRKVAELLSSANIVIDVTDTDMLKKYKNLDLSGREHVDTILQWETDRMQQLSDWDSCDGIERQSGHRMHTYLYMQKIAAAGIGFYFEDIPKDLIEAPYMPDADFIIGVSGDSMEPTFYDGDMVYVHLQQGINVGEIGIFTLNNECYIKEAGTDELISHNPKYKPIPGTENIKCVGRVLGKVEL